MKKLNTKGFTLIELLAVITIMGILMIVAIPAVTRTIENSRKDTFIDMAKQYASSAKTWWAADNLYCSTPEGVSYSSSAVPEGIYYIAVDTTSDSVPKLLESGGKSSWGSRDVKGYVKVHVSDHTTIRGDVTLDGVITNADSQAITKYLNGEITLSDTAKEVADVNGDGQITSGDSTLLIFHIGFPEEYPLIGDNYKQRTIDYYPALADDIHGVNIETTSNVKGENLKRGNLVMQGATYSKVSLPAGAYTCVEQ